MTVLRGRVFENENLLKKERDTYCPVLSSVKECRKYQRPGGIMKIYNTK
jgi:hypothetical protein